MGDWTTRDKARGKDGALYGVPQADEYDSDKLTVTEGAGLPAQRICGLLVRGEGTIALLFTAGVTGTSVWAKLTGR